MNRDLWFISSYESLSSWGLFMNCVASSERTAGQCGPVAREPAAAS